MVSRIDIRFRITCPHCGRESHFPLKPEGFPDRGTCRECSHHFEQGTELFAAIRRQLKEAVFPSSERKIA